MPARALWSDIGIHVFADNAVMGHPDLAILFDSANPTGGDFDLVTPGYGWDNGTAEGKLLIIAENDVGLDLGSVSDPDDEAAGGTFYFRFEQPVILTELTLIDVDASETAQMRSYGYGGYGNRGFVNWASFDGMGDNARQSFGFAAVPIRELEVELSGSGGIASLDFIPCPVLVGYDTSTTGVPIGLKVGEVFTDQMAPTLGFQLTAESRVGPIDKAVVFDTARPTGGDTDLMTPGYHPTNHVPLGQVAVLAENEVDLDHDGLIDDPDDDANGGWMTFDFQYDVVFQSATVIDIDVGEQSFFTLYDANGRTIGFVPLAELGDNSVQTVTPAIGGARKVVLELGGSGALAGFEFCHDLSASGGY
jgi:hypothetical protein